MADNLKMLSNVLHNGIQIKSGMIVDPNLHGLGAVAQDLIARGLAVATQEVATHTLALVDGTQAPMPVGNTSGGQKPNVEADAARKAAAAEQQQPVSAQQAQAVADASEKESQPIVRQKMPTSADVDGV